jgi:hypothetical protein
MQPTRDRSYLERRERDERRAALAATTSELRSLHLQMAYYYAALIAELDEEGQFRLARGF